ncbi:hypothetical protein [Bacillus dakarensis]|uniref:hypothetical protein n=1 Tax=Robertmurraya dakarensis TaxID=1926278 RepID=UPI000980A444|nr:hypothetical protein [Bacillus dakarensis]
MKKNGRAGIERGQAITFRLPSDTPDHLIQQLQELKDKEKRNFSSKIAEFVLDGVNRHHIKEKETVTIPLPRALSKEQRNWLKHAHSEALLGSIIYQMLADPVRASSFLASFNSHSLDIDEALFLQEQENPMLEDTDESREFDLETDSVLDEDDLMELDWNQIKDEQAASLSENEDNIEEDDVEDLLGGFLSQMNK